MGEWVTAEVVRDPLHGPDDQCRQDGLVVRA
jgi:hypothetical protein